MNNLEVGKKKVVCHTYVTLASQTFTGARFKGCIGCKVRIKEPSCPNGMQLFYCINKCIEKHPKDLIALADEDSE